MGRYDQNKKKYELWTKEGRGQGYGKDYKPWLTVHDVPSSGRSHRVMSNTVNRVVHCLSDLEFSTFLSLEWAEAIIDIREQFPLSLESTQMLARKLGFRHPSLRGEKVVMSTDFLASVPNPRQPLLAIQVKPSSELSKTRVKEKLAIEEAYWNELNVPFEIVTEETLNTIFVENIRWLIPYISITTSEKNLNELGRLWRDIIQQNDDWNIIKLASEIDKQRNVPVGTGLSELRELFAKRIAYFDMNTPFFKVVAGGVEFGDSNNLGVQG